MTNQYYLYDDNIGSIELVQSMGEDITIVNAARVSFGVQKDSIDEKDCSDSFSFTCIPPKNIPSVVTERIPFPPRFSART